MYRILFLILFIQNLNYSQSTFEKFITEINSTDITQRQEKADSFYTEALLIGLPLIENNEATFIYNNSASSLYIAGDFNGWDYTKDIASRITGTTFFYLTKKFELNARLDYKFVLNGSNWILDPGNNNIISGGFGPNSELAMPEYVQPWEINFKPDIKHGKIINETIFSKNVNKNFSIAIYLPPEYYENNVQKYPSIYFQDGAEYITLGSSINIIDNLIDSNFIEKVICVFVNPNNRNEEYAFSLRDNYVKFFANELVPHIDSIYRTIKSPEKRLVIGDSYGGNISGLITLRYPELFGNCGLHSAAFQPNNYEVFNLWVNSGKKDVNFYSVWGSYESLDNNMMDFSESMKNKGYNFTTTRLPEGHSWGLWRATTDLILQNFFPVITSRVGTSKKTVNKINLLQNYPNPFNPITNIIVESKQSLKISLFLYNIKGEKVKNIAKSEYINGNKSFVVDMSKLSSGIYFAVLTSDNISKSIKILFLK